MRFRGTERSSILLLGRNTVVIGAVVITILSFGLGYFLGFKGGDFTKPEDQKEEIVSEKPQIPPAAQEEKRVLESSPEQPIAPPIKPFEAPQEAKSQKPAEKEVPAEKEAPKEQPKDQKAEKAVKTDDKQEPEKDKKQAADDKIAGRIQAEVDAKAKAAKPDKTPAKAKTAQKPAAKKAYTIQFGAFPNKEGAEQLQQNLKAKKIKAYIVKGENDPYFRVRTGEFQNKKEADRQAATLEKQTGLQNFVTTK
jgi:cell division septation protein DedD